MKRASENCPSVIFPAALLTFSSFKEWISPSIVKMTEDTNQNSCDEKYEIWFAFE